MKSLKVSKQHIAIVDDRDYNMVSEFKWVYTKGYATTKVKNKRIYMHRLILGTPKGLDTDHIDGDKLNNIRCNLRIVTHQENGFNSFKQKNNTSGYKGVTWNKQHGKWKVQLGLNYGRIHLGYFVNVINAAKAYDVGAIKYFDKKYAKLNFPMTDSEVAGK